MRILLYASGILFTISGFYIIIANDSIFSTHEHEKEDYVAIKVETQVESGMEAALP